jgi:defect-in-organelle-trafficking protein DotC
MRRSTSFVFGVSLCVLVSTSAAHADTGSSSGIPQYSEQELMDHPSSAIGEKAGFVSIFRNIRERAILQAAESFGSQAGYCAGVAQWNAWAHWHAKILNDAYDFSSLLVDGGRVLPPVILEDSDSYLQKGKDLAVTAQTTWHILRYGRIVSVAPTWRNYLLQTCASPLKPNPVLLPKTPEDRAAWKEGIQKGWEAGESAARKGFLLGLHRMTRDYAGMLRFWLLHKRGVMSAPLLSTGTVSTQVDGRTLSVGQRVFRLVGQGSFKMPKEWKPVIEDADSALAQSSPVAMEHP